MILHTVSVHGSKTNLHREDQLAWKLAEMACDPAPVESDVVEMIINRIIDNAAVAIASLNRQPVINARAQALSHPHPRGATLTGDRQGRRIHAEWAAWANGVAVRELDYHDTFLAADYAHPADTIPALVGVAQQCGRSGADLIRGIAAAYEIHVNLTRAICLHAHKIDHIAHLGPAIAGGIGAMLGLATEIVYQAIQQALHVCCTTRQSRKGAISSWKAYAPAHAGKLAIEAVDRAMRGEASPTPIYEGEDSVIAWLLDGKNASYTVPLPARGEPKRAILETYTKAHSAEYQSQALIDLAFRLRKNIPDLRLVREIIIHTSHHTHYVIGTGAGDPQKFDPQASRETLDHSIMYIFAVALEDGAWSHDASYTPERASRAAKTGLWQNIRTMENEEWTRRYHSTDPSEKAFGGRVEVIMHTGDVICDEITVADAHPLGARPYARHNYIAKLNKLATCVDKDETDRFLALVERLPDLGADDLININLTVPAEHLAEPVTKGLFE